MKCFSVLAIVSAVFMGTAAIANDEIIDWKYDVKGWRVAVDTTLGDGCFMFSVFEGGTFLRVQLNPNESEVLFFVGNPDWKSLEVGKLYPMSVQLGYSTPWTGNGEGVYLGDEMPTLLLSFPTEGDRASDFIDEFMKMTSVRVKYDGRQIAHLSLRGTFAAMKEVLNCQREVLNATSNTDPFAANRKRGNDPFK